MQGRLSSEVEPAGFEVFAGARLTWLPFRREARSLLDPSTGLALQEGLLG